MTLAILQTQQGQTWAFNQLIHYMENKTQAQIQIGKMDYAFPFNLRLEDLSISQDHHPIVSIQHLELCCAFPNLLQGRVIVSKLQASNIDVHQLPKNDSSSLNQDPQPWNAPLLPFYLKLENIDIQHIHLTQPLLDTWDLPHDLRQIIHDSRLNLQGMVSNNPFRESLTAHLLLTLNPTASHVPPCHVRIDTQHDQLSLSFHCHQFPLPILAPDLPSTLQGHLAFYASASAKTWQDVMQNSWEEDDPIEGLFTLSLHSTPTDSPLLSVLIGEKTSLRSRYLLKSKRAIELFDLKVNNPSFVLQGEATLTSQGEIQQGSFTGEIENLERFQPWLGKDVQGHLAFEGKASGAIHSPSMTLHLESPRLLLSQQLFQNVSSTLQITPKTRSWDGSFALAFDYQNIPLKVESFFDWNDQKRFILYQLKADALNSHLEGEISCSAPDYIWEGSLEGKTKNLQDILHVWSLSISGESQLKLQLAAILDDRHHQKRQGFQAELIGRALRWMDGKADQLTLRLNATPFQEKGELFAVDSYLEGQQISWKDYSIESSIVHATHHIHLTRRELIHLSADWNAQQIQGPQGKADQSTGQIHLDHPFQTISGTLEITFKNIQTPTAYFETLAGASTLHPSQTASPFRLHGQGTWKDQILFDIEGTWLFHSNLFQIQANRLNGQFGPYPLKLLQPIDFAQHPEGMQLTGLHLQWGEAEIQANVHLEHQHLSSTFKTNAIPSELFHFIAPNLPLVGRASFQGYLEGSIQEPKGQFQIDLHNIQIIEDLFAQKPFITGRIHLDLEPRGIWVKSELNGIGHTPFSISGTLPITLNLDSLSFGMHAALPFDLALNAEGELDPYLHLFYNDVTNLSGHAKIALRLSGQMNAPQIQGHIDLLNGAYESLSTGAIFHHIEGHLEGNGSQIILTHFSAKDNKQGSITATGSVSLDANQYFPFDFQIRSSHLFILDSDYAAISASGPLHLIGNMKHSKLQGELTVDQAGVHLEEALPRQIKTVEVKYINSSEGEPHLLEKKEKSSAIDLDVALHAPQHIMIKDNHLKSEWKGSIAITGTVDHPQLHGDLRLTHGEYDFNGKVFNLSQGNIHFAGAPGKKTTLYVVASQDIDRIRAEIIVKGPVNKPVISFRSNPPLSQREVLSYILFNRGISDITADQGDQLSQSFISLHSNDQTKGSSDFLSRLRNNMGIDRLDFTTNDQEHQDFGLQVGKNITENISVSVNQSMTTMTPVIAVEAKLRKNLKAQAEAGVNVDSPVRMSIKWKKDY